MQIRGALEEDLPILLQIERDNMKSIVDSLNPEPWSDSACLSHLKACLHRGHLWICEDASGIVGHYCYSPVRQPKMFSLDSIQVLRGKQGKGIGSLLLEDFIKRATSGGASTVALNVHLDNPAIRLYERFGFCEIKRSPRHIRMEKELELNGGSV